MTLICVIGDDLTTVHQTTSTLKVYFQKCAHHKLMLFLQQEPYGNRDIQYLFISIAFLDVNMPQIKRGI